MVISSNSIRCVLHLIWFLWPNYHVKKLCVRKRSIGWKKKSSSIVSWRGMRKGKVSCQEHASTICWWRSETADTSTIVVCSSCGRRGHKNARSGDCPNRRRKRGMWVGNDNIRKRNNSRLNSWHTCKFKSWNTTAQATKSTTKTSGFCEWEFYTTAMPSMQLHNAMKYSLKRMSVSFDINGVTHRGYPWPEIWVLHPETTFPKSNQPPIQRTVTAKGKTT